MVHSGSFQEEASVVDCECIKHPLHLLVYMVAAYWHGKQPKGAECCKCTIPCLDEVVKGYLIGI